MASRAAEKTVKAPTPKAHVIMVGRLPYVTFTPRPAMSSEEVFALTLAADLFNDGFVDFAEAVLTGLQQRHGVRLQDHVTALWLATDATARELRRRRRLAETAERARVRLIGPVDYRPAANRSVLKNIAAADALSSWTGKGRAKNRKEGAEMRKQIAAELELGEAAAAASAAIQQRLALHARRGGEAKVVPLQEERGYVRVRDDDGLELVQLSKDKFEARELRQAGYRYRDLYRSVMTRWSSCLAVREGSSVQVTTDPLVWAQLALIKRRKALIALEARVAAKGDGLVSVLRAVAGEGQTLRAFDPTESGRRAASARLTLALKVVYEVLTRRP